MSSPTAKELLAQADRLMRQRTPEELPVLTDLVIEENELTSVSDRVDELIPAQAHPWWMPAPPAAAKASVPPPVLSPSAAAPVAAPAPAAAPISVPPARAVVPSAPAGSKPLAELFARHPRVPHDSHAAATSSSSPGAQTDAVKVREQFNEQLLAKLEELQHNVFSQVMQKLEIHAAGSLKTHLRETLEPVLIGIMRDLADQVAEDTATQVRQVVSDAVDSEIARLREQFVKKRF